MQSKVRALLKTLGIKNGRQLKVADSQVVKKVEFLISSVSYDKWEINEEEYFLLQWMIKNLALATKFVSTNWTELLQLATFTMST